LLEDSNQVALIALSHNFMMNSRCAGSRMLLLLTMAAILGPGLASRAKQELQNLCVGQQTKARGPLPFSFYSERVGGIDLPEDLAGVEPKEVEEALQKDDPAKLVEILLEKEIIFLSWNSWDLAKRAKRGGACQRLVLLFLSEVNKFKSQGGCSPDTLGTVTIDNITIESLRDLNSCATTKAQQLLGNDSQLWILHRALEADDHKALARILQDRDSIEWLPWELEKRAKPKGKCQQAVISFLNSVYPKKSAGGCDPDDQTNVQAFLDCATPRSKDWWTAFADGM